MPSTPESLRGISRRDCERARDPATANDSWRSNMTLPRTAPALVGVGVVLRGTAPTLLMRVIPGAAALPSPPSGAIQSIKMPPSVLWLSSARPLAGMTPPDGGRESTTLSEPSDSVDGHKKDPGDAGNVVGEVVVGIKETTGAKVLRRDDLMRERSRPLKPMSSDDLMRERSRPHEPLTSDEPGGIPGGATATN
jgi:hypothetical protein